MTQQSNPFSTGSGGPNFETRVQAALAVLMLAGGNAPCLPHWPIHKIKLQGKYAGFEIDDLVVFVQDPTTMQEARLLAQVKHSVNITEGDPILGEVIRAAWGDINNPQVFSPKGDSIALITGCQCSADINDVRPLLEWARHCETSAEFIGKIDTPGFGSASKTRKLSAFRTQLGKAKNADISDEELWQFLKSFHLLSYDLDTDSSATLSLLHSLIGKCSPGEATHVWSRIVDAVQTANQNAGTLTLDTLPRDVVELFDVKAYPNWPSDFHKLQDHGNLILKDIRLDIGGVTVKQPDPLVQLINMCEEAEFVFVTGPRGCGKSSLVRGFVDHLGGHTPFICIRAEDLNKPHLDNVFAGMGLVGSLGDIEAGFALMPKKYLIIESLEKLLELQYTSAFTGLLHFVRQHPGWTVVATGRDYAYQQIAFNYLQPFGVRVSFLEVRGFSESDLQYLCDKLEPLKPFIANPTLKPLMTNPFFVDLAHRASMAGAKVTSDDGEQAFRNAVWEHVIAKEHVRVDGMPLRRKQTFIDVAVRRAKEMVYGIPETGYDGKALLSLEEDGIVRRDHATGVVGPAHDVLEDWALDAFIEGAFCDSHANNRQFIDSVGPEPAMNRAFRLWLHQKMRCGQDMSSFVLRLLSDGTIARTWHDEAIAAVLLGDSPHEFLGQLRENLFANDAALLKRFCFILRISCKAPDHDLVQRVYGGARSTSLDLFLTPHGRGWEAVIHFLFANKDRITGSLVLHVTAVLSEWSVAIHIDRALPSHAREAGLLAIYLLELVGHAYGFRECGQKLTRVMVLTSPSITAEFRSLLERDVLHDDDKREPDYVHDLVDMALTRGETAFLCKHMPDDVIKLAWQQWLVPETKDDRHLRSGHLDVDEWFGLREYKAGSNFFPASGKKGPFAPLLHYHQRKGLDFIMELCNKSAMKYALTCLEEDNESPKPRHASSASFDQIQVDVRLADQTIVKQLCMSRFWAIYRGHSVAPFLLQSALMALENWLIDLAENSESAENLEWAYDHILRNSNSVLTTAVLASVATGFPNELGKASLPILRVPVLYDYDLRRTIDDSGVTEINWHNTTLNRDAMANIYAEERRRAALRPWRREHLETLIVRLQLGGLHEQAFAIIDELHAVVANDDERWRFRFHRIDSRGWTPQEDKKNNCILFRPTDMEPDLQEIQRTTEIKAALNERFAALWLWSQKLIANEPPEREYYKDWSAAITEAKALWDLVKAGSVGDLAGLYCGGIVKAASIAIRDHSNELVANDLDWCIGQVVEAVVAAIDTRDPIAAADETDHSGAGAAACVLPITLSHTKSEQDEVIVRQLIVAALTQENSCIRTNAANGVREHLWQRDSEFAQQCMLGSLEFARLYRDAVNRKREAERAWLESGGHAARPEDDDAWLASLRDRWADGAVEDRRSEITFHSHSSRHLLVPCLMVPDGSTEECHVSLLSRVLSFLVNAEARENAMGRGEESWRVDNELPTRFARRLAEYLLSVQGSRTTGLWGQLENACETAPRLVWWFMLHVAVSVERSGEETTYWTFWNRLFDKVLATAVALSGKSAEETLHDARTQLIRGMLYADAPWQKVDYQKCNIRHGKDYILKFVAVAGTNVDVFEAMASLIYHFPAVFLNDGLPLLAKHLQATGGAVLLSGLNTGFCLERSIQRYLLHDTSGPIPREMHRSCSVLLDAIVDTGSSSAYYSREHLIHSRKALP